VPPLRKLSDGHLVACHWAEDIKAGRIQPQKREAVIEEQMLPHRIEETPLV
jgi:peptide/nickel transport system ATP-binding protein